MAVKKSNTRIIITISKKQYNWLVDLCSKKQMKMSKLISWLLWQKTKDVEHTTQLLNDPEEAISKMEEETISDEEFNKALEKLGQIAQKEKELINGKSM